MFRYKSKHFICSTGLRECLLLKFIFSFCYIFAFYPIVFIIHISQELGLLAGTPVGTSLIDAHAGGVGVMESKSDSDSLTKGILCYYSIAGIT